MFSKALFKQSSKANGLMWGIITFAVCFMLACVMVISGSGSIGVVKNSIEDTIIVGEIDAAIENRAITNYKVAVDGLEKFDDLFSNNIKDISAFKMQNADWFANPTQTLPETQNDLQSAYLAAYMQWKNAKPSQEGLTNEQYQAVMTAWQQNEPTVAVAYSVALSKLAEYELEKAQAIDETITTESSTYLEMYATVMFSINPSNMFDEYYTSHNEVVPADYDVVSLIANIANPEYLKSEERVEYIKLRASNSSPIFLAHNMTLEENVNVMLEALSSYGVTKEKYDSFNYDYQSLKHTATTTILSYKVRFDYELGLIDPSEFTTVEEYLNAVQVMDANLTGDLSKSLLKSLPEMVSDALQEVGQMDLYSLIVGSIFFKMAGLLLPIIFMIMASNNLIAGQVDSGSMAYVLSTSTKRKQVAFTQAIYLIISLFAMFCCTTVTSVICLACLKNEVGLTYGKLILLNLGAFLSLFAMSGICFMASCWFDRSKKSMSIGGGLSMFFLVATMLGLFGSPVIPSVLRLDALNYFNYVTIISLFDSISILGGTLTFLWKFAILIVIGIIGYVAGSIKFKKKDLPL